MRRLVVASAILATLLTTPLGAAAAATRVPAPDPKGATAALEYLLAAQSADGSIDKSIGETADFVIGAAAAGYDAATLRGCAGGTGALEFLATASDAAATDAAKTGKTILAVVAAGEAPTAFAGRNLMTRLAALYHSATGKYGDGSTFGQAFAILAVAASGGSVPTAATNELRALQDKDGSWSYGKAPVAAGGGDTNSTAIAVMALDRAGVRSADESALAYLATQQLPDGGFPYQNSTAFGPPASDPDSDSIVLQAIIAAGRDPSTADWSKGTSNVLTHMSAGQLPDGGFVVPGSTENAFTTSQAPAALMRVPYGAAVHPVTGTSVPNVLCPNAAPVPTPIAGAAASSTAAAASAKGATTAPPTAASSPAVSPAPSSGSAVGGVSRRRVAAVAIAVLIVLLLVLGGAWLLRTRSRKR
jgi:hypothetical protein